MHFQYDMLKKLAESHHVCLLTGAGVSAESGIKTFRDKDGLWTKFNPQELASVQGFMSNPALVLAWYRERVKLISQAKPNAGHKAIAEMQDIFPRFTLITQNIDRLHQSAGSHKVTELHGNIVDNHCFDCRSPYSGEPLIDDNELAKCPHCGGLIRPSVVWFGELLPMEAISAAEEASIDCDVFFSVGTSAEVYPAANLPIMAQRAGATLIEVNPNSTALSHHANYIIRESAASALPALIEALKNFVETQENENDNWNRN